MHAKIGIAKHGRLLCELGASGESCGMPTPLAAKQETIDDRACCTCNEQDNKA
jgi:hypothetical protein